MSKRDIRERLIRFFVSALVREDLSLNEQRAIISSLGDLQFMSELQQTVGAVFSVIADEAMMLRQNTPNSMDSSREQPNLGRADGSDLRRAGAMLDQAEAIIRQKRMSKAALRDVFEQVDAQLAGHIPMNVSLTSMLHTFFIHSTENRRIKLLTLLASGKDGDEYLRGISERSN